VPAGEQGSNREKDALALAGDGALDVADYAFYRLRDIIVVQKVPPTKTKL
jgi:hypothetical protein